MESMSTARRWWTFTIVSIALFMAMLDNLVVTTALPSIQRALHAGVADLEWTVNAYTLAFAVLMIPAAALGDRFGRRRLRLLGVARFTAGSATAALSHSATALTFARAFQGVGAAGIMPLTLTILVAAFPAEKRAAAIGLWSGISGLGLAAGPLVGGAIVSGWSWNAVFWINVPIGIALLVLGRLQLDESHGEIQPLDIPGIALIGGGLLGIVYGLVRGNTLGWSSAGIVGSLVAGTLLTIAFLVRERTARNPMLDLQLFNSRALSVSNAVGFLMSFGMFGSIFLLTLFIQNVLHFSPFRAGLGTMPWTATIMVVAPFAGIIAGRIGARPLVLVGMAAQAGALLWIGLLATATVPYVTLLPAFILGGLGMGLTFAPLSEAVMGATDESRRGQASGAYNTIRELGGVFGIAVLGAVFQHIVVVPGDFLQGFRAAVFAGAAVVGIGVLLAALLPSARLAGADAREGSEDMGIRAVRTPAA
jgi:EmrB/QacA subfamily drug resistance transporter